jgi:flagellar hook-length control protein FliK
LQQDPAPDPAAPAPTTAVPASPATIFTSPQAAAVAPPVAPPQAEPRQGVRLAQAAETVRLTIASASTAGVTRARIALRPAELGGIEIMLSHGPGGISATVTAESPAAAHALQRAADQLQRSLADQGVNLLRLDIDVAGDRATASGSDDHQRDAQRGNGRAGAHGGADTDSTPTVERTLELPGGVLVDVLA